jgi:hypothetical protein
VPWLIEQEMFEAYTTLSLVAAHTERVRLGAMVSAASQAGLVALHARFDSSLSEERQAATASARRRSATVLSSGSSLDLEPVHAAKRYRRG